MKHVSASDIREYFLHRLPVEKDIRVGIHLDECKACFAKAERFYHSIKQLNQNLDAIASLPHIMHRLEDVKSAYLRHFDEYANPSSLMKRRTTHLGTSSGRIRELAWYLNDPSIQITPLPEAAKEPVFIGKTKVHSRKIKEGIIEYQIDSASGQTPSLLSHSQDGEIEITVFKRKKGSKYYSAIVPQVPDVQHYMIQKVRKPKKQKRKAEAH